MDWEIYLLFQPIKPAVNSTLDVRLRYWIPHLGVTGLVMGVSKHGKIEQWENPMLGQE